MSRKHPPRAYPHIPSTYNNYYNYYDYYISSTQPKTRLASRWPFIRSDMSHHGRATRASMSLVMMIGDGPTASTVEGGMPGDRNCSTGWRRGRGIRARGRGTRTYREGHAHLLDDGLQLRVGAWSTDSGGYKHLEHKQWAHRPHRPNGESPPGLTEPPKQAPLPRVGLGS